MPETDSDYLKGLTINQRIAHFRKINDYNQERMAKIFRTKTSTYSQRERKGNITCEFLIEFCHYLDVDIRLLLYGKIPEGTEAPLPQLPQTPSPKEPIIISPGIIVGARQKNLLKILHYFSKKEREAVYKFVDMLRQSDLKEFITNYPTFFEQKK